MAHPAWKFQRSRIARPLLERRIRGANSRASDTYM